MRRDDRDRDRDPFDDLFRQLERMMNEMMGGGMDMHVESGTDSAAEAHSAVYEEEDLVRVVVDLPGVEKDAISLECDGRTLSIDATSERREYTERVSLPARVDEHAADATFNNGVLEVTFERADASADINVE
ncbi:Hsp20/alpha crystallin family protein [Halobacteriales archaeon QS_3_64_16]|jgi:HSP20 family protein|nr:MAG: Hsp20/alpha crystallin family protein [Halobacteriales archaeon QS_3_64_16]